jgi:hypothetical protein
MSDPGFREIADRAAASARTPDFRAIAKRGTRRRRLTTTSRGVAGVALASVAVLGIHGIATDRDSLRPTAPTTTPGTSTQSTAEVPISRLSAQQIVTSPRAQLLHFAASADNPDVRASLWRVCASRSCVRAVAAVAVTTDAFDHSSYAKVAFTSSVTWAGGDEFVVQRDVESLDLVSSDGTLEPIRLLPQPAPLTADEILVTRTSDVGETPFGIDLDARSAHLIPLPSDGAELVLHRAGDQTLWGVTTDGAVALSTDGGASWRRVHQGQALTPPTIIASADPSILAYKARGGRVDNGPFVRTMDSGANWQTFTPRTRMFRYVEWTAVTPEGRLLVDTSNGIVTENGSPNEIHESDGLDWTHFHLVQPSVDGTTGQLQRGRLLAATSTPSGGQRLFVLTNGSLYNPPRLYVSSDDARTWAVTRTR